MIITANRVFVDGVFSGPLTLAVAGGRIAEVRPGWEKTADFRLESGFLTPGLIDLHNNGAFSVDFCAATPAAWDHVIEKLAERGVTSLLPTVITAPLSQIRQAAERVAAAMARHPGILGLHLEGPFLAPQKAGAHNPAWLQAFTPETAATLLALPALRLLTLAPELPGALPVIRQLAAAGVTIALGHSAASAAEAADAAAAGARLVTHVFNAQSPLNHRAPGLAGVALTHPGLFPCLIADGLHVDKLLLKLAFTAHPHAIAVTDSILAAGMAEGFSADFGGDSIMLQNGIARRPDGTIAGAAITLDDGIRRLVAAGIPPEVAFAAATERPAAALNLPDRGRIAIGQRADLIWWRDDLAIAKVFRAGQAAPSLTPAPRGTETARPELAELDALPTPHIVAHFFAQEARAQQALNRAAPSLAALADAIALRLQSGGKLYYAGAGTSGRLALLDAVECFPTFGVGEEMLRALLAGGPAAFLHAVEGAEDDAESAIAALSELTAQDALVGIAASGRTPFTLAAIKHANAVGALTGAIVNNLGSPIAQAAQIAVEIDSGPEIIAGSTRLSAGTTQKIALNTLSSTIMIRLGKTYGPYMVDVRATNEKLKIRAMRMVATLADVPEQEAAAALAATGMHVKTAVVMLRRNCTAQEAKDLLEQGGGSLRKAIQ